MTTVRILADDLTGALDAASPFVAMAGPIPVRWSSGPAAPEGSLSFDSETRNGTTAGASSSASRLAELLIPSEIAFKKIDSLLRGHPAEEIAACIRAGGFASAVVTPAFPSQNRVTRNGIQFHRAETGDSWRPVGIDLAARFRDLGMPSTMLPRGGSASGAGLFLCDAEEIGDLENLPTATAAATRPLLWCGSAGLARALAGDAPPYAAPRARSVLTIVGSDHPVAARQRDALMQCQPAAVVAVERPDARAEALASLEAKIDRGEDALLAIRLPRRDDSAAAACMTAVFAGLATLSARPAATLVVGGDTLFRLATALGANGLAVDGELSPGIPCSRFVGGAWTGIPVVSKSGAFGGAGALVEIVAAMKRGQ